MTTYIPLQQQAYEYLLKKISSGAFESGVFYSEKTIAQELGISRTPVNDALARLSQARYIDIIPSRGFCLHQIAEEDIWNTYQFRTAIEGYCALELTLQQHTEEGRAAVRQLVSDWNAMEESISQHRSLDEILDCDLLFHEHLVAFLKNSEFLTSFESYRYRLRSIAYDSFQIPHRPEEALEEHREILSAIQSVDTSAGMNAYLAVKRHMEASRNIGLHQTLGKSSQ